MTLFQCLFDPVSFTALKSLRATLTCFQHLIPLPGPSGSLPACSASPLSCFHFRLHPLQRPRQPWLSLAFLLLVAPQPPLGNLRTECQPHPFVADICLSLMQPLSSRGQGVHQAGHINKRYGDRGSLWPLFYQKTLALSVSMSHSSS